MIKHLGRKPVLTVLVFALFVNLGAGMAFGLRRPLISDAEYFLHIAENLTAGKGYVLDAAHSFWPDEPSMRRLPLWPMMMAGGLKVAPWIDPNAVARVLCLVVNACAAAAIAWLTVGIVRRERWDVGSVVRRCTAQPAVGGNTAFRPAVGCEMQSRATLAAVAAGAVYTLHPGLLHLSLQGLSEPLSILLVALGLGMMTKAESRKQKSEMGSRSPTSVLRPLISVLHLPAAALLLGLSCLVRANFVLFPIFLGMLLGSWWLWSVVRGCTSRARSPERAVQSTDREYSRPEGVLARCNLALHFRRGLVVAGCLVLFYAPVAGWITRNYRVCGHPAISTLKGQTIYGGNNELVANDLNWWGYWVFPNSIPGEMPMHELAKTMSEYEVDKYYTQKAAKYAKENWFSYPRLLLGKLVRAYVPIPWKPSYGSYAVSAYRWLLYLLVVLGLVKCSAPLHGASVPAGRECSIPDEARRVETPRSEVQPRTTLLPISGFRFQVSALLLTNLAAVLVFWGNARFAFSLEPFFLPIAAMAFVGRAERGKQKSEMEM